MLQFAIWEKRLDGKSPAAATKIQTLARKVSVFSFSFFLFFSQSVDTYLYLHLSLCLSDLFIFFKSICALIPPRPNRSPVTRKWRRFCWRRILPLSPANGPRTREAGVAPTRTTRTIVWGRGRLTCRICEQLRL